MLPEEFDPFVRGLAGAYARPKPSAATRSRISVSLRSGHRRPIRGPQLRISLTVAALLVALGGLTGGANALKSYGLAPQSSPLPSLTLGTRERISSSLHGYTLTVTRTYADANRVVLGYTMRQAPNQSLLGAAYPLVTASDGQILRRIGGETALTADGLRGYAVYDASALQPTPAALTLTVEMSSLQVLLAPDAPGAYTISDPITMDLTVLTNQRRLEVDAGQLSISEGIPLTLKRAILTPTEARVDLFGASGVAGHDLRASLSTCGVPVTTWGTVAAGSPSTVPGHLLTSGASSGAYQLTFPVSLGGDNSSACALEIKGPRGLDWTYRFEAW
jgi:hypothetical protein